MWKDKKASKPGIAVSRKDVAGSVDAITKRGATVLKPRIIQNYNLSLNGCDRLDQNVSYYNNKLISGGKRIFARLLEVSQINAQYIVFTDVRMVCYTNTFKAF